MTKFKIDFMVIEKPKSFSVHGRRSYFENGEWHWASDWHLRNYKTMERAEAEAAKLNTHFGRELSVDAA